MSATFRVACVVLLGLQVVVGLSAPPSVASSTCTVKTQRKPWQALTSEEKSSYINATLCLIKAPSKSNISVARTRWDDLQYTHAYQMNFIHGVGQFLPWHRYYITVHERLLRDECGYTGPMAYWNESAEATNIGNSEIFNPITGFGGNGTGTGWCVSNGPFANLTLNIHEDLSASPYCLVRRFNPCIFQYAAQPIIDYCLAKQTFEELRNCLEGLPHVSGHAGVGGTMLAVQISPGDPVFWLHHTYLDKIWWEWQSLNLSARLTDMSGNNKPYFLTSPSPATHTSASAPTPHRGSPTAGTSPTPTAPVGGIGSCFAGLPLPVAGTNSTAHSMFGPNPALTDYFNDGGDVTTLNHTLFSFGLSPNMTIRDIMDVRDGFVCAEYL